MSVTIVTARPSRCCGKCGTNQPGNSGLLRRGRGLVCAADRSCRRRRTGR